MVNQKHCPFCKTPARLACQHLALAASGREFVRCCIDMCHGHHQWQSLCRKLREQAQRLGEGSPDAEDFTWLETAFCDRFLRHLRWFGAMEHEWRAGKHSDKGGFCVLLWSRDPQRLWWELLDEIERQLHHAQSLSVPLLPQPELFAPPRARTRA